MIVRNGVADGITRAIKSTRPFVDEIVVYDTGSTDGTLKQIERLASKSGAPVRVERGEWRSDFAWAREQSLSLVSDEHEWVLWLDADEELVGGHNIGVCASHAAAINAPCAFVVCDLRDGKDGEAGSRLLRRGAGQWEGIIHEHFRADARFRDQKISSVVPRDVMHIRNHGKARESLHYLSLLEEAARDPERTPRALCYLGRSLLALGRFDAAQSALKRYLGEGWDAIEGDPNYWRRNALEMLARAAAIAGNSAVARDASTAHAAYVARLSAIEAALTEKPGRNDLCPCGSGKKHKKCHGA